MTESEAPDARAGFSLIEMVAVMAIVALVASLAIAMTPGTGRAGLKAVAMRVATLFRQERLRAVLDRRVDRVALDGESRVLVGDAGGTVAIPSDVALDLLGADQIWAGRTAVVEFEPDGQSSGAVLRLSRERAGYAVTVNWYTGAVTIDASQAQ